VPRRRSSVIKPRDAFFQSTEALDVAAAALYESWIGRPLLRMVVDADTFVPAPAWPSVSMPATSTT
jgi:hypothetical protein